MKKSALLKSCFLLMTTAIFFLPSKKVFAIESLTTPTGEVIATGSVTFDRPAAGQLDIHQTSQRAIIDWDNFDIGKNAKTEFFQPGNTSLAVNRVVGEGSDPTQILGALQANGRLMILDRNGILFGKNATVNVGGIIASTGNVLNSDITDGGTIEINDVADAPIENRGNITVADAGLVAFVAPIIKNSGVINARFGRVGFGAGSQATVDFFGDNLIELAVNSNLEHALIHNRGDILAEGGNVSMTTRVAKDIVDNSINMNGIVNVSSIIQQGGKIILSGASDTTIKGDLLANSEAGGGDISISSSDIGINRNAHIEADTTFTGVGGHVTLNAANSINSVGKISANGEEAGGKVIITAGDNVNIAGKVEARGTGASNGGLIHISSGGDETRIASTLNVNGIDEGGVINLQAENMLTLTERSRLYARTLSTGAGGQVNMEGQEISTVGHINVSGQEGGGQIDITSHGNLNAGGSMTGYSGIIGRGAKVSMNAIGDVNLNSRIQANGTSGGGQITINGDNVSIGDAARLYARGLESELPEVDSNPGGHVSVNADNLLNYAGIVNTNGYEDGGGFINLSGNNVTVFSTGLLHSSADHEGDGGTILLQGASNTLFGGRIVARGGAVSGDGGFVKFNQPNTIESGSSVDVSAPNGNDGTFVH